MCICVFVFWILGVSRLGVAVYFAQNATPFCGRYRRCSWIGRVGRSTESADPGCDVGAGARWAASGVPQEVGEGDIARIPSLLAGGCHCGGNGGELKALLRCSVETAWFEGLCDGQACRHIWRMRKFPQSLARFSPFSRAKNTEISIPAINQL